MTEETVNEFKDSLKEIIQWEKQKSYCKKINKASIPVEPF